MPAPPAVRIGCYSAFWGDSSLAASQLITMDNPPQFVVADYLAEVTMGILARQSKSPAGIGYVREFVDVYKKHAVDISSKGITLITNAGGLDPLALKSAIDSIAAGMAAKDASFVPPIVAAVFGDDAWIDASRRDKLIKAVTSGRTTSFGHLKSTDAHDEEWPKGKEKSVLSVNVYLGVAGILSALRSNATIILTGRVVDSALVLAPLMHTFSWPPHAYDLLAAGSLAGHILECGCHATGGNFTDWRLSAQSANGGWSNMGYPIAEVEQDGTFVVTKRAKTGGIVSVGTVAEQLVYEVLDPKAYLLPDVVVDLTGVKVEQVGVDRVLVSGARGRAPGAFLKTSGVYVDGFKVSVELVVGGAESVEKARCVGEAVVKRVGEVLRKMGEEDFVDTNIECLGSEHTYGPNAKATRTRETVLRLTVLHRSKQALSLFAREVPAAATCMAPGITGLGSGRSSPSPNLRHFSVMVPKPLFPNLVVVGTDVTVTVVEEDTEHVAVPDGKVVKLATRAVAKPVGSTLGGKQKMVRVRLIEMCYGRSGDKGDTSNIGLIARDPKFYPHLLTVVTAERVKAQMGHLILGYVERFELPGIYAMNFVCTQALGGGGLSSLQVDRQGKTYGQMLLQMKVEVPENWGLGGTPVVQPGSAKL
ncbi:hypothetical protein HDU98_000165 [Podochytrium sp. JEL0797]|nr:hypothetical protein HDU98_000165 [Podochytrium sp. JEL0797]